MIDTLLPPCQSWPPSYSSSSSLILHRGGETFSFFAKWICPHVFGRGKNSVPSSASRSRAGSVPYRYHRRHLHRRAREDRHGLPVRKLHDKRKGTRGRPGETIRALVDYFKLLFHHDITPTAPWGRSTNSGQRIWADSPVPVQPLGACWPTKTPQLAKPRGVLPT